MDFGIGFRCTSGNRVLIYWGSSGSPKKIICPTMRAHQETLKLFSQTPDATPVVVPDGTSTDDDDPADDWPPQSVTDVSGAASNASIIIEFIATQSGSYSLKASLRMI